MEVSGCLGSVQVSDGALRRTELSGLNVAVPQIHPATHPLKDHTPTTATVRNATTRA